MAIDKVRLLTHILSEHQKRTDLDEVDRDKFAGEFRKLQMLVKEESVQQGPWLHPYEGYGIFSVQLPEIPGNFSYFINFPLSSFGRECLIVYSDDIVCSDDVQKHSTKTLEIRRNITRKWSQSLPPVAVPKQYQNRDYDLVGMHYDTFGLVGKVAEYGPTVFAVIDGIKFKAPHAIWSLMDFKAYFREVDRIRANP